MHATIATLGFFPATFRRWCKALIDGLATAAKNSKQHGALP